LKTNTLTNCLIISIYTLGALYGTIVFAGNMPPSLAVENLLNGTPVILHGETGLNEIYQPRLLVEKNIEEFTLVSSGLWLQKDGETLIEHQLRVYDLSLNQRSLESEKKWLKELTPITTPEGYTVMGSYTEVYHHEPYGVLETRIEVLKIIEVDPLYDWYDISVYQVLTPGANYTSRWEWSWLSYTMNGTRGQPNIALIEYDPPPQNEAPSGIFSFLWKILRIDIHNILPWLKRAEPRIKAVDLSDYDEEVFKVKYSAPREYSKRNEPLRVRHHYVVRVTDGDAPMFWHQT